MKKFVVSCCVVVGVVLVGVAGFAGVGNELPGTAADSSTLEQVVGGQSRSGPCENKGNGNCTVTGTIGGSGNQLVCDASSVGVTCGANAGPINRWCTGADVEQSCHDYYGPCALYKKCTLNTATGYYVCIVPQNENDQEMGYSWQTCRTQ